MYGLREEVGTEQSRDSSSERLWVFDESLLHGSGDSRKGGCQVMPEKLIQSGAKLFLLVLLVCAVAAFLMFSGVLLMLWWQKWITGALLYGFVVWKTFHTPIYWLARAADWMEAAQVATLAVIRPTVAHWRWQLYVERANLRDQIAGKVL